jgi:hypothetical protein
VRDNRGKAKQVTTFNGRTVIIKENSVYSNKGEIPKPAEVIVYLQGFPQASNPSHRPSFCPMRFITPRPRLATLDHGSYTTSRGH